MENRKRNYLLTIVALLLVTVVGVWFLRRPDRSVLALSFESGETVRMLDVRSLANASLAALASKPDAGPELRLLAQYFSTSTLDEIRGLYSEGEGKDWTQATFDAWKKSRDLMERSVNGVYRMTIGEKHYRLVMYNSVFDGQMMVDTFLVREKGNAVELVAKAENVRLIPVLNFFRTASLQGVGALMTDAPAESMGFPAGSPEAFKLKEVLVVVRRDDGTLHADQFLREAAKMRQSSVAGERAISEKLLRVGGVHPLRIITASGITPEHRLTNGPLLTFMASKGMSSQQADEVLLLILNKQYMPAAQRLRQYSGNAGAPVYDYVMKIREYYGPVIQISGQPAKDAK